ncbi:MAG: hypothetical protein JWM41_4915 [Gemmatimonadetes bacterium]|nr:hypothetical protein [Gemmatimonadota bacterium]
MIERHEVRTTQESTIFDVLAAQASTRSAWQLGATAVGATINAGFFLRHAGTQWLGLAFVAVGIYGAWGLVEAEAARRNRIAPRSLIVSGALGVGRAVAIGVGVTAVLASAAMFMAAAIGNWNH